MVGCDGKLIKADNSGILTFFTLSIICSISDMHSFVRISKIVIQSSDCSTAQKNPNSVRYKNKKGILFYELEQITHLKVWIICFYVWFQPFWSLKISTLLKLEISNFIRVEISTFRRVEISKQTNTKADESNFYFQAWKLFSAEIWKISEHPAMFTYLHLWWTEKQGIFCHWYLRLFGTGICFFL